MIQLSTLTSGPAMPRAAGSPPTMTSDFALALAQIAVVAPVPVPVPVPVPAPASLSGEPGEAVRQPLAAIGTILPPAAGEGVAALAGVASGDAADGMRPAADGVPDVAQCPPACPAPLSPEGAAPGDPTPNVAVQLLAPAQPSAGPDAPDPVAAEPQAPDGMMAAAQLVLRPAGSAVPVVHRSPAARADDANVPVEAAARDDGEPTDDAIPVPPMPIVAPPLVVTPPVAAEAAATAMPVADPQADDAAPAARPTGRVVTSIRPATVEATRPAPPTSPINAAERATPAAPAASVAVTPGLIAPSAPVPAQAAMPMTPAPTGEAEAPIAMGPGVATPLPARPAAGFAGRVMASPVAPRGVGDRTVPSLAAPLPTVRLPSAPDVAAPVQASPASLPPATIAAAAGPAARIVPGSAPVGVPAAAQTHAVATPALPATAADAPRLPPVTIALAAPVPLAPPQPAPPQPAAQVFAAAMFAADRATVTPREADDPAGGPAAAFPLSGVAAALPGQPLAVQGVATPGAPALDLTRDTWMGTMIERIETLTAEGGSRETRMRLTPDALGQVDIAIRHDASGGIEVRIAADTPQARAILAEAAPRLAELAEQRGLKLGGSGVDAGGANPNTGSGGREAQRPAPAQAPRPATAGDDAAAAPDTRLA